MLVKVCRRFNIPKPPLGYWAKASHGHMQTQPPLPEKPATAPATITFRKSTKTSSKKNTDVLPELIVWDVATPPHPLTIKTRKALETAAPDKYHRLSAWMQQGCLDLNVSRYSVDRALKIWDAILHALDFNGYKIKTSDQSTSVMIFGEEIRFRMEEPTLRSELPPTQSYGYQIRNYSYQPSGKLSLIIDAYGVDRIQQKWSDTEKATLEFRLNGFLNALISIGRFQRDRTQEWAERDRKAAEARTRAEDEEKRKRHISALLNGRRQAIEIRQLIQDMEEALLAGETNEKMISEFHEWAIWAKTYADAIDPVACLKSGQTRLEPCQEQNLQASTFNHFSFSSAHPFPPNRKWPPWKS